MTDDTQATIQALPTSITELCNEPVLYTESDFISGGITRRQLVETACRIKVLLEDEGRNHRPVCLWTEDRGFFMAAILAALCGGPELVIPHTLSEQVVAEACRSKNTHVILSDNSRPAPGGVRLEVPDISKTRVHEFAFNRVDGMGAFRHERFLFYPSNASFHCFGAL